MKIKIARIFYQIAIKLGYPDRTRCVDDVLNTIISRNTKWMNTDKMPEDARIAWGKEAEGVLNNAVFQSVCGKKDRDGTLTNGEIVKTLMEDAFKYDKDGKTIRDARMIMVGIERVREEIERALYHNTDNSSNKDLFSPI